MNVIDALCIDTVVTAIRFDDGTTLPFSEAS